MFIIFLKIIAFFIDFLSKHSISNGRELSSQGILVNLGVVIVVLGREVGGLIELIKQSHGCRLPP